MSRAAAVRVNQTILLEDTRERSILKVDLLREYVEAYDAWLANWCEGRGLASRGGYTNLTFRAAKLGTTSSKRKAP